MHLDTLGNPSTASGGVLDLYGITGTNQSVGNEITSAANLAKRTSQSQYTGFTCATNTADCTFLARLNFVYGANTAADTTTTIVSPENPVTTDGTAQSYLSVDTTDPGLWSSTLNDNFFTLDPNNNPLPDTPDIRLTNSFAHGGGRPGPPAAMSLACSAAIRGARHPFRNRQSLASWEPRSGLRSLCRRRWRK